MYFGMDVKVIVLLQLINKSKLRNGTKTFLETKIFPVYSLIKKITVYCPFNMMPLSWLRNTTTANK